MCPEQITLCIVLLFLQTYSTTSSKDIKLGLIMPFRHPRLGWENNAAAVSIAVEKAQSEGILKDYNISIHYSNDSCNAVQGVGSALHLREVVDVDIFIGPPCSTSTIPTGLLANNWNLPMFSMASTDPSLGDKSVYNTLVRLGPPFNRLGLAMLEIFRKFGWSRVVLVSRRKTDNKNVFCDYSSRAADETFRANNMTVGDWIYIDDGLGDSQIKTLLDRIRQRGRIVILCTENSVDKRQILLQARASNMADGEYVFIIPDQLPPSNVATPWVENDANDEAAKDIYTYVFQITVAGAGNEFEAFRDLIPDKMMEAPWFYNYTKESGMRGSQYSPFLHDVVYLYLLAVNDTLSRGLSHRDGRALLATSAGKTFTGITGTVKVDSSGDREPDYWLWDMKPGGNKFSVVLEARMTTAEKQKIVFVDEIVWGTNDGMPPPDIPRCGFTNEKCPEDLTRVNTILIIASPILVILVLIGLAIFWYFRKMRLEKELDEMLWQIPYHEIRFTKARCIGSVSQMSLHTLASTTRQSSHSLSAGGLGEGQLFSAIGVYKGMLVAIKKLSKVKIAITRQDKIHFKGMRDLNHENVNSFIGLCLNEQFPCTLSAYCAKGSLQDIIEHDDINLDWMFRISLINDMTSGLQYLHNSEIRYHGNVKSSNCLVDNRWVLKLADFGLGALKVSELHRNDYEIFKGQFWTAPEILRTGIEFKNQTDFQRADVYSYGIVLWEILYRSEPYDTRFQTPKEIISRIAVTENPPYRPDVDRQTEEKGPDTDIPPTAFDIVDLCVDQSPDKRPTVDAIKSQWETVNKGKRINIVDNMICLLERYANNLEDIVEQRTSELIEERKKSDILLYRMLPQVVADKLKVGQIVAPEIFEEVTIYFSDIVGFTNLASASNPIEIVDLLNDLYTSFDSIIGQHDVYKVETIGDAYMVVSGLPVRNEKKHVSEIANMALDLLTSVSTFKIHHAPEKKLLLRIGLHTGSCAAGVVGLTMPRYCLFGDTVNMASRMESTGEPLKIHASESTYEALSRCGGYSLVARGVLPVKGKGCCSTYWLLSRMETSSCA